MKTRKMIAVMITGAALVQVAQGQHPALDPNGLSGIGPDAVVATGYLPSVLPNYDYANVWIPRNVYPEAPQGEWLGGGGYNVVTSDLRHSANIAGALRYSRGEGITVAINDSSMQAHHPLLESRWRRFTAAEVEEEKAWLAEQCEALDVWPDERGTFPVMEWGWYADNGEWWDDPVMEIWGATHGVAVARIVADFAPAAKLLFVATDNEVEGYVPLYNGALVSDDNPGGRDNLVTGWVSLSALWALRHAQVINCSHSGVAGKLDGWFPYGTRSYMPDGAFYAVAGGNDGISLDENEMDPSPRMVGYYLNEVLWDRTENVAAVGNLSWNYDRDKQAYTYQTRSNYGARARLWAGTTHGRDSTSFATPVVSAAAALALALNPDLTPAQLRTLMEETASPFEMTAEESPSGEAMTVPKLDANALLGRIYADMYPWTKVYDFADRVEANGWQMDDKWGWFCGYAGTNWVYHLTLGWVWIIAEPEGWQDLREDRVTSFAPVAPPVWYTTPRGMVYYRMGGGFVYEDLHGGRRWLSNGGPWEAEEEG